MFSLCRCVSAAVILSTPAFAGSPYQHHNGDWSAQNGTMTAASRGDASDEKTGTDTGPLTAPPQGRSRVTLVGTVTDINGREFTLDTGSGKVRVDTMGMGYNPLDDRGFQQIDKGEKVSVNGRLNPDFSKNREMIADSIITLNRDAGKSKSERTN